MNRTRLYALIAAVLALFASNPAKADQAKLLVCVQKCTEQMHICITGQEPNLSVVCNGVAECNGLDQSDLNAFHNVCALCIKGVTENCPGGEQKAAEPPAVDKSPPGGNANPTPPPPDTFESRCKSLGGEPITDVDPDTQKSIRICLTLRGLHHRLSILEAKMAQYKGNGQPVPPALKEQAQKDAECTQKMLDKVSGQLSVYEESVKKLVSDILGGFGNKIRQIDRKDAEQDWRIGNLENRPAVIMPQPVPTSAVGSLSVSSKHALTGLYVGPYYGRNLRDHYGVALHAVGMEMGLLPSLSETGRWRLELNFGVGHGGYNKAETADFRVGENLWEMHAHVGPRYTWDSGLATGLALTGGLGMNRRATFSHDDVAATWIGAFIQPSYNLPLSKDGHGLYILSRLGIGNTHHQHAIVDQTGNKLDYVFNIGVGYAFMP